MTRLLTITDIARPLSPLLEKYVHSLFCDNISIFDWLQTTAAIPTPTLPCPVCLDTSTTGADCQLYNDYAINPIGARIVSLKCLRNHILFSRVIVHKNSPMEKLCGTIYHITCDDDTLHTYIGGTKRPLSVRFKEHC